MSRHVRRVFAVTLVTVGLLASATGPASAAFPGSNGSGFSKLLRYLPRNGSPRTSCW